jgi:hypothetical protein
MRDARLFDPAHFGWQKDLVEKCFLGMSAKDDDLFISRSPGSSQTLHISSIAIATLSRRSGGLMAANST